MAERSVFFITKNLDVVSKNLMKRAFDLPKKLRTKMEKAIDLVYKDARTKRPDIGILESSTLGRIEVRGMLRKKQRGISYVSDPNAEYGVPVRTGRLRDSIKKEVKFVGIGKIMGRVWSDEKYAPFVEYGSVSKNRAPRPFMRTALDRNKSEITKILGEK